jgi:hypothetical protein
MKTIHLPIRDIFLPKMEESSGENKTELINVFKQVNIKFFYIFVIEVYKDIY